MSGCEDLVLEFWKSPPKKKRKKSLKKNKMWVKPKQENMETEENVQKKKKKKTRTSKFKRAMEGMKEKKKDKRRRRSLLDVEDSPGADPESGAPAPHSSHHLTPDPQKKTKRRKRVAFDLSPGYICVKRPERAAPKPNLLPEPQVVADVRGTQPSQENDSQCTSDDINSQDLFITQKTFRTPSSEPCSAGAGSKAAEEQPQQVPGPLVSRKPDEGSKTHLQGFHQHLRKSGAPDDPGVVRSSMDVTPSQMACRPTASISTQTENFFTAELCSYLSFFRRSGASLEVLKPLDLSLSHGARKVKAGEEPPSEQNNGYAQDPRLHPSAGKSDEGLTPAVRQLWGDGTRHEGPTAPGQQGEPKSAETTSSEDNESVCRTGRLDLTQVRAVQTRLNESFFFKTKGDGQSPRPESPLMKLVQSRGIKNKKSH